MTMHYYELMILSKEFDVCFLEFIKLSSEQKMKKSYCHSITIKSEELLKAST
jgi:hypothetical protein